MDKKKNSIRRWRYKIRCCVINCKKSQSLSCDPLLGYLIKWPTPPSVVYKRKSGHTAKENKKAEMSIITVGCKDV